MFGLLLLVFQCSLSASVGKSYKVVSPDGKTEVKVSVADGRITYSLSSENELLIKPSRLGFLLDKRDSLCWGLDVIKVAKSGFDQTWSQPWGEEVSVRNHYNELKLYLQEKKGKKRLLNIVFRAFNDGIGFRYEFPKQQNLKNFSILSELTEFYMVSNDSAWTIPAYKGVYYENLWKKASLSTVDTATTPVTIERGHGRFMVIHEANLTDYAKMNVLSCRGTSLLKVDLTPWSTGVKVYARTPFVSPWRIIVLADNLNELANSRLMLNLNEPSKIKDVSGLQPSKYIGIWWGMHMEKYTWAQGAKHGATTENTKKYIDFAAAHHMQGVLVEGWNYGWDGDWVAGGDKFSFTKPYPDYNIDELARYAKNKGVDLIGHNETGGATINYENQLDSAFRMYQRLGIRYVKTGYVNSLLDKKEHHDGQYGVRHYRKVIETAARYGIVIDNHEPVIPTGLQRTYPNLMSQEGVRGQEYDAWSQDGGNPPEHTCIVPFTRGLAGPMDFTFGTFNFTNTAYPKTRVQTTLAKQLALYVVIYSPLQMASDLPENYGNNPTFRFIEQVPADWAKTIVLDGKIGEFVVTARKDKQSDDWYLGAITNDKSRTVKVDFSFLEKGKKYKAEIYKDGDNADWKTNPYPVTMEEKEITSESVLDLYLVPGGGTAIRIKG